jgi:hypothetical protein
MAYPGRLVPLLQFDEELAWDDLHDTVMGPVDTPARREMWQGFVEVCGKLRAGGLPVDVFIGGGFLTHEARPDNLSISIAVRCASSDLSALQRQTIAGIERERESLFERCSLEFDFILEEGPIYGQTEALDIWLSDSSLNDRGPPVRAVMVKLCQ